MIMTDVRQHAQKARQQGRRYLLVCYDCYDRMRGDDDLGYYYPAFNTATETKQRLAGYGERLGRDVYPGSEPGGMNDVCVAVVDLETAGGDVMDTDCLDPRQWLAAQAPADDATSA